MGLGVTYVKTFLQSLMYVTEVVNNEIIKKT